MYPRPPRLTVCTHLITPWWLSLLLTEYISAVYIGISEVIPQHNIFHCNAQLHSGVKGAKL